MTRESKQPQRPEKSTFAAPEVPGPSPQEIHQTVHRSDEDWVIVMKQQMSKVTMDLKQLQEAMDMYCQTKGL
eukprot:12921392-Prorocentrum_lima.AAC.1